MNEPEPPISQRPGGVARDRVDKILNRKHQRQALAASRALLKVEAIPIEVARRFRPLSPMLVEKITDEIQKEVVAFAGPRRGRRHRLIHRAVDAAVTQFLDIVENKPSPVGDVHELFRRMGYAEAIDANDLDAMRAAHLVATQDSWEAIRRFGTRRGMPAEHLAALIDAILAYVDQLIHQTAVGYLTALEGAHRPVHEARRRLLSGLLVGRPFDELEAHVETAGWTPPENPSVLAALVGPDNLPALPQHGPDVLVGLRRQRLTMLGEAEQIQELAETLAAMSDIDRVAVSWSLPLDEIRDAYRWTYRALDLAAVGVIVDGGVIYCAEYCEELWLHADPRLSQRACEELLAPLESEKPHHRLMLAETMLLWLETRESAPSLARRMDVHGQTVRHRLKKLKELFGGELSDPRRTLALLSALELTIPKWRGASRSPRKRSTD